MARAKKVPVLETIDVVPSAGVPMSQPGSKKEMALGMLDAIRRAAFETAPGQHLTGSLIGGLAGYGVGTAFNAVSPWDVDPNLLTGMGMAAGGIYSPQYSAKANQRLMAMQGLQGPAFRSPYGA